MKNITIIILILFINECLLSGGTMDNPKTSKKNSFIPQWKLGDTWEVEYQFQEPSEVVSRPDPFTVKEIWLYEIIKEDSIHYTIKISSKTLPLYYLLCINKTTFTIISFSEIENTNRNETINKYLNNAYMRFSWNEKMIFDFGAFYDLTKDTCIMIQSSKEPTFMQEIVFNEKKEEMILTLTGALHGQKIISQQTWNKKSPWWIKAQKTIDNEITLSGVLISSSQN